MQTAAAVALVFQSSALDTQDVHQLTARGRAALRISDEITLRGSSRNFSNPIASSLVSRIICWRSAWATHRQYTRNKTLGKPKVKHDACSTVITALGRTSVENSSQWLEHWSTFSLKTEGSVMKTTRNYLISTVSSLSRKTPRSILRKMSNQS